MQQLVIIYVIICGKRKSLWEQSDRLERNQQIQDIKTGVTWYVMISQSELKVCFLFAVRCFHSTHLEVISSIRRMRWVFVAMVIRHPESAGLLCFQLGTCTLLNRISRYLLNMADGSVWWGHLCCYSHIKRPSLKIHATICNASQCVDGSGLSR